MYLFPNSPEKVNPNELKLNDMMIALGGCADFFRLKIVSILPTDSSEKRKNGNVTSANHPYHLILLLSDLISISLSSGFSALIRIVRLRLEPRLVILPKITTIL